MEVWAEDEEIVCIHPGGPRLTGYDRVRESWTQIFASRQRLQVRTLRPVGRAGDDVRDPQPAREPHRRRREPPARRRSRSPTCTCAPATAGGWSSITRRRRPACRPRRRPRGRRSSLSGAPYRAPWWLPGGNAQTIWAAVLARRRARAARAARALGHARRRLRRRRLRVDGPERAPLRRAVPRARRRLARVTTRERHHGRARAPRLARRDPALPRLQRRAQPAAARLPLGRRRRDRLDAASASARSPGRAALRGRRLARRQRAAQVARRTRRRRAARSCAPRPRCRRRSTCRRRAMRSSAASARVYTRHLPAHAEARRSRRSARASPAVRRSRACARRARCASSTICAPRRCTASATPTTTGRARAPSRCSRAIRVPTLILNARNDPFLPGRHLPGAGRGVAAGHARVPATGGHVGFVAGPFPGHYDWLPQRMLAFFSQVEHHA